MLFQSMSLAFYNNAAATFTVIEKNQQTMNIFANWLDFMQNFKQEFEIRRILFGFAAMLTCDR